MKGNKRTLLVLLAIVALLGVSLFGLLEMLDWLVARSAPAVPDAAPGVGVAANGPADTLDPSNRWDVVFPAYQDGRDAANAAAYDHTPFIVTFSLPEGWLTVLPPAAERTGAAPYTPVQLVDAAGEVMGTLGFEPMDAAAMPQDHPLKIAHPTAVLYVPDVGVRLTLTLRSDVIDKACFAELAKSLNVSPVQ